MYIKNCRDSRKFNHCSRLDIVHILKTRASKSATFHILNVGGNLKQGHDMKRSLFILHIIIFTMMSCENIRLKYPGLEIQNTEDNYFGITVSDPYRILENDTSSVTIEWLKAEKKLTTEYFDELDCTNEIQTRLMQFSKRPDYWLPTKKSGKYFYYYKDSTLKKRVYCCSEQLNVAPKVLINTIELFQDENIRIAGGIRVSDNAKYLAFKTSQGGEDWNTIHVMNIETKKLLPDKLKNVKYSDISWSSDGFYYCRYDNQKVNEDKNIVLKNHRVYYHKLGESQLQDNLVFENSKEPLNTFLIQVMPEGQYLFIKEEDIEGNERIYFKNLDPKDNSFTKLIDFDEFDYSISGILDDEILIRTNKNAPNNKLIAIDTKNIVPENWRTIIEEKENLLRSISHIGGKIVALYMIDACAEMDVLNKDGSFVHKIPLPSKGWSDGFSGSLNDTEALFSFSSFTYPYVNYKYDIATNEIEIFNYDSLDSFNPEQFITKQVFFESKDSTIIPMFITHKKGIKLNGNNPTYIYAYGGFNISQTPQFNSSIIPFLEKGGVYVVPNLRGGGEYGENWHKAGTKLNKQNVFDDFISATEWLIMNNYTNPRKITIAGRSNGGLLVGAVITQRPELFKVAIPEIGVMDMLRYHKFTIGMSWAGDYGTSDESKEMFEYLYNYSPYHNIKSGVQYPATLIVTGSYDDRVIPAHSYKFAAAMQASGTKEPVLLYVMDKKGHEAFMPEYDRWAFIMKHLEIKW